MEVVKYIYKNTTVDVSKSIPLGVHKRPDSNQTFGDGPMEGLTIETFTQLSKAQNVK